jgi:hypothetical protein
MMTIPDQGTEEFIDSIHSELERVFAFRPSYGSAGITCFFHEGKLIRIEASTSISRQK